MSQAASTRQFVAAAITYCWLCSMSTRLTYTLQGTFPAAKPRRRPVISIVHIRPTTSSAARGPRRATSCRELSSRPASKLSGRSVVTCVAQGSGRRAISLDVEVPKPVGPYLQRFCPVKHDTSCIPCDWTLQSGVANCWVSCWKGLASMQQLLACPQHFLPPVFQLMPMKS